MKIAENLSTEISALMDTFFEKARKMIEDLKQSSYENDEAQVAGKIQALRDEIEDCQERIVAINSQGAEDVDKWKIERKSELEIEIRSKLRKIKGLQDHGKNYNCYI